MLVVCLGGGVEIRRGFSDLFLKGHPVLASSLETA